jgi:hypothetical protein
MPADPIELERARDRLVQLTALHRGAATHAAHVPRIGPDAWRGPAYELYLWRVDALASRLRAAAGELGETIALARGELLDAAG